MIERARVGVDVDPTQELLGYEAVMWTQMGSYDEAISILKRYMPLNPDHSFQVGGNVHWWWRVLMDKPEFKALTTQRR